MRNYYKRINARLIGILLLMVAFVQVAVAQESVQIPAKDEVLNTLKAQHPRLISTERVEKIKQVILEDELAKKFGYPIWNLLKNYWIRNQLFTKNQMVEDCSE